jgi:hypothetical protein
MLGLGLGSHKASALRSLAAKLLAKLRGRSTYYENNQGSKDTIQEIDNYELLNKATILLTPTATSDARVHSVKTYTGNNLLPYSTFYSSSSSLDNSSGKWVYDDTATGTLLIGVSDRFNAKVGSIYKVSITISNLTGSGSFDAYFRLQSGTGSTYLFNYTSLGVGTTEFYTTVGGTVDGVIERISISANGKGFTLEDIQVYEANSDFSFDRASSATRINSSGLVQDMQSITDPELVTNGGFDTDSDWSKGDGWDIVNGEAVHTGSGDYIEQGSLTPGNQYEVVIVVTQSDGVGFPQIYMGGLTTAMTSPDTYTFYITAQSGDKIKLRGLNNCKVDSVSVKDITFSTDVDLARINYDSNGQNGHILLEPTSENKSYIVRAYF